MLYEDLVKELGEDKAQEDVKFHIANSKTTLVFTKANGDTRTLIGSNSDELVPSEAFSDSDGARKPNDEVQVIYDLEADGWRSFRWDRLVEVSHS